VAQAVVVALLGPAPVAVGLELLAKVTPVVLAQQAVPLPVVEVVPVLLVVTGWCVLTQVTAVLV
jgi:hypothetical protein